MDFVLFCLITIVDGIFCFVLSFYISFLCASILYM